MADRSVSVILRASVSDYMAKMSAAGKATSDLAAKVEAAKAKTAAGYRAIGVGAVASGALVVGAFGEMAKAAADFDSKMALVQTLLKAQPADMAKLRVAALSVGQAYGYSAGQVADAEAELAKAGIGVKEQLGGALVGALTLAAAGQTNVAEATEIVAAAMTQFELHGKDVPHIADLLAAGADRALGSVADLGQGLAQAGPVAHQFGVSIEDTVGTLAAFAQSGQIGERGGTIFSQMLLKMAAPSKKAKDLLHDLGITMYDTSGNFVGMTKLAGELSDNMSDLDNATRNTDLAIIFGQRAIRGSAILYREGADGIQDWIDKVNAAGFADLQASGKLNSLSGDWLKFKAAIGAASIEAGEPAQGPLRTLVQDATAATNAWEGLPGPVKATAEAVALAGGAATLAGGAALLAVPKWEAMNLALTDAGLSAVTVRGALAGITKASVVGAAIYGVVKGVDAIDRASRPAAPDVDKLTASLLLLGQTGKTQGELLKTFGPNLQSLVSDAETAMSSGIGDPKHFWNKISPANIVGDLFKAVHLPTGWDKGFTDTQHVEAAREKYVALDQALANLSEQTGGLDVAKDAWVQLSAQWVAAGNNAKDLVQMFPQFSGEIQSQSTAAGDAAAATGDLTQQLAGLTKQTQTATKAAQSYNDKLHAAADPLFAMNQALQGVHSAQSDYNKAVEKYGAGSGKARQASLDVASSMLEAQAAAKTLAASVRDGGTSMANARRMVAAFGKSMGLTKTEAHLILREFDGLISRGTKISHLHPVIKVSADTSQASAALAALVAQTGAADRSLDQMSLDMPKRRYATGGYISGPGTGTSDSIPALLSNGEYVMPAAATAQYGPELEAMRLQRFAKGGHVGPPWHSEGPRFYGQAYDFFHKWAKAGPYNTDLSASDERAFERWVQSRHVPFDIRASVSDYDMRGYWLKTGGRHWHTGSHFPDTFKTPYDTTFSRESRYATKDNPFDWRGNNLVDLRNGRVIFSPRGFARGGMVSGPGGTDRVPAMLSAGEYVMPAHDVAHFAKGGKVTQGNVERRLRNIISDRGSSPHDVQRAIRALNDLATAWDVTLRRIGNEQQLRQLKNAVSSAKTPGEQSQAEHALAQFRRQRDQDAATRRIQAAQDLATNRQTWLFERMSVKEQISYLDKAMAKEKRFSDQWLSDAEQRRSLRQSEKQDLAGNKAQWQFENMSAAQQVAFLDKRIAKEKKFSDQWLADMEQRQQLVASMTDTTSGGGSTGSATYTTSIAVPDMLGATYNPWIPASRGSGMTINVYASGVMAADKESFARQVTPAIRREMAKTASNNG